jgi:hypothetical protein
MPQEVIDRLDVIHTCVTHLCQDEGIEEGPQAQLMTLQSYINDTLQTAHRTLK